MSANITIPRGISMHPKIPDGISERDEIAPIDLRKKLGRPVPRQNALGGFSDHDHVDTVKSNAVVGDIFVTAFTEAHMPERVNIRVITPTRMTNYFYSVTCCIVDLQIQGSTLVITQKTLNGNTEESVPLSNL